MTADTLDSASLLAQAIAAPLETVEALKQRYLHTPRGRELKSKFDHLYKRHCARINNLKNGVGVPQLQEGAMLAVTGETQAGKTREIAQLFRNYPEFAGYEDIRSGASLISIRSPPGTTAKSLAHVLVQANGLPLKSQWPEHALWKEAVSRLEKNKISVVHIDEMQHATQVANEKEILRLGASLKGMLLNPTWPVLLVISGVPTLETFLRAYPELLRRTHFVRFADVGFDDADNMTSIASKLCRRVGLNLDVDDCNRFGERLIAAANRQFGGVVEWTTDAVAVALSRLAKETDPDTRRNGRVDHYDFAAAYCEMKDCPSIGNIFLSERWEEVDPATGRLPEEQQTVESNPPRQRRRSRRK